METIPIKKENLMKAYNKADSSGKALLTNLFGKNVVEEKITDRIKRFEDTCSVTELNDGDERSQEAYQKLILIARELNEGWEPNWEDTNEYKWFPYFKMKGGFGFALSGFAFTLANASVGSRLCFKSEELANYAGKKFESIYKDYLTL